MGWWTRIRNAVAPARLSSELDREIAFHIQEATDRLIESGMAPDAAAREAAGRFGHHPTVKDRTRDFDVALWLESLGQDLRYAVRSLKGAPGFTLAAVLSLGLGIGANTAIFSLVDTVILRTLPVERPDQLVKITMGSEQSDVFTNPLWEAIRDQGGMFNGIFAFGSESFNLAQSGQARMVDGAMVSGGYFSALAVPPAAGRLLQPTDDQRGCAGTVVLSHGFWQRELGGRPDAIGGRLTLNRQPFTIIGITPRFFTGLEVGREPQVYVPICSEPLVHGAPGMLDQRSTWWLQLMGRLPEGQSLTQVGSQLAAVASGIYSATLPSDWDPDGQKDYLKRSLSLFPAGKGVSELRLRYQTALFVLMGVVAVVLLIACANVANLLLARAASRQREIAMRMAIGASRGRVIRQVLTESLLLSTAGALIGLFFARWSSGLLPSMVGGRGTPARLDLPLDWRLLGFTVGLAVLTGLLFGVAPAWRAVGMRVHDLLKSGGASASPTGRALGVGRLLVVGQVALSLLLVALAGLLVGSFRSLTRLDPGFSAERVVLARLDLSTLELPGPARQAALRELLDHLRAAPGIEAVGATVIAPMSGMGWNGFVDAKGFEPADKMEKLTWFNGITEGYFGAIGTPLLAGREFTSTDRQGSPRVAVVNRAFVRKFFGEANPIGQQILTETGPQASVPVEIVGIVGDSKYRSLRDPMEATVYVPWEHTEFFNGLSYVVRGSGPLATTVNTMLRAAGEVLPNASFDVSTLSGQLERSLARERLLALLSGFFGTLALVLALIGLYGIMAYNVTRRRKEIGIRVALGATRARLVGMVTGEAGRLVAVGLVLGAVAVAAATRLVASFLYGRTPLDPTTMIVAVVLVALVALAAGALPAVRAVRQDPQSVLREE